ncbi:aldehyde dehydrogenase family protein [Pajaroellobacter abortibovis]|uniref:Aldehyde dehydrogenase domain-containing protein n=1 Tax=Pajaroellobacter abortibovis TaxID=1882918 RepID=A0A1L6MW12_9BACT|nr:aldehyde dehydrogenase family protein [Pajaroellobacter abortibovis]APR99664.1 hypothetical protein BCY86_02465 [Pajaroellobacter abortibovis]
MRVRLVSKVQSLHVHTWIARDLFEALRERVNEWASHPPLNETGWIGPLMDEASVQGVHSWCEEALQAMAHISSAARSKPFTPDRVEIPSSSTGLRVIEEKVFGPVLVVQPYREWEHTLAMTKASRYGLWVGLYTDSAHRICEAF